MDSENSSSASCRIVVVSSSLDTSREVANRIKALSGDTTEAQGPSEVIHWTIKNKYYTAPVHFHPIHLEGLESIEMDDVPAVIYAWKENEPYKVHMKHIAEQTSSYNPEVSLAISMTPTEEEQLEDFFFEHGFEYVEGHSQVQDRSAVLSGSSDAPGLNRAVDALSTIMWPSMVRAESNRPKFVPEADIDGDMDETDMDLQTLKKAAGSEGEGKSNMQREMDMLEKWLEEDDVEYSRESEEGHDYSSLYSHDHSQTATSRMSDAWPKETVRAAGSATGAEGFDDDFTEFVSASSASAADVSADEGSEPDLPSTADMHSASARIFGTPRSQSTALDAGLDMGTDREMDSPAFDLTRIVGALQDMKEEISRIPDERERRRAAAKAALGFVYGLERG